ncbi:DUF2187 family protein [uncultured Metabacillus sp.]|uniref:DUF2187 family protein n=2 Tax=Metabacillus TaxID=2675233 RepID=UPI00261924F0|nr:DUF2187 family protein [uncultured Metabacillus sp.]
MECKAKMNENNIAKEGEKIRFERNGLVLLGEVVKVREESVIVQISKSDAEEINVETPLTVVSHKNYQIIKD